MNKQFFGKTKQSVGSIQYESNGFKENINFLFKYVVFLVLVIILGVCLLFIDCDKKNNLFMILSVVYKINMFWIRRNFFC